MSLVYYKFKSAKNHDHITFDGTGISVFDLKREIILAKRLGKGTDFDLSLYHPHTDEGRRGISLMGKGRSSLAKRVAWGRERVSE